MYIPVELTYSGSLGEQDTALHARTMAPKKHFSSFFF